MEPRFTRARRLALTAFLAVSLIPGRGAFGAAGSGRVGEFIGDADYSPNAFELDRRAGQTGAAAEQPWTGSFWALHSGSVANPYNEDGGAWLNNTARKLKSVDSNYKHFEKRLFEIRKKLPHLDDDTLAELAPSEKYDLFLGDYDFSFTQAVWSSLLDQYTRIGRLALWEGSCHGWSTAAAYTPRPKNLIRVMSLNGKHLIPFYPDDLKGLATILWANSLVQDHTRILGNRCQTRNPEFDGSNGKVLNESCEGVNPGDLHVILLEMMGARKQTFIINRSNKLQIWNQPVARYELKYFNLATGRDGTLAESIVPRSQYNDPFTRYRHGQSVYVVGVRLKLRYTAEREARHRPTDDPSRDKIKGLVVHYDLELDSAHNVVGGEWISATAEAGLGTSPDGDEAQSAEPPPYPGFIWKFSSAKPMAFSIADFDLPGDDIRKMDRLALVRASKKAASFKYRVRTPTFRTEERPQPLSKVVNYLLKLSHEASGPAE